MATMTVRTIGILSLAKMAAVLAMVVGIFVGVFYGLIVMLITALNSTGGGAKGGFDNVPIAAGLLVMVGMPLVYAVAGFLLGALVAFAYNVAARFFGGIEVELTNLDENK